jgi:drug/metabolite transporter (DMT)-like permease
MSLGWETLLLLLIVVAGTSGELCVTRAMKTIGEVKDFRPAALVRVLLRAVQVPWMWLGITLMALAFFALLGALSIENVSFVVPVTALSYAAGALGGQFFLGEKVSRRRWAGVALVCAGVTLVFIGRK